MFTKLGGTVNKLSENFNKEIGNIKMEIENISKNKSEIKKTISEINNTLEGIHSPTKSLLLRVDCFLPGESQGWGSLVGCPLWGRTESDTTEAT